MLIRTNFHMKTKIFLFPLFYFLLSGCSDKHAVKDFEWLEGNWEGEDSGLSFYENWKFDNENSMTGLGGAFQGWDTVFKEVLKIQNIEGRIFYIATIPGNPGPVHFKLVSHENNKVIFENSSHDFPEKITYKYQLNGMLHVLLEGIKKGEKMKEELYYIKTK